MRLVLSCFFTGLALLVSRSASAQDVPDETPPTETDDSAERPPELPFVETEPEAEADPTPPTRAAETAPAATDSREVIVVRSPRQRPRELGLSPGAPRAPGGLGYGPSGAGLGAELEPDWSFQFHGYLSVPIAVGMQDIEDPAPGQSSVALHTPPQVADPWGYFEYANVVPGPWVQLNLSYGNPTVTGTVIVAAYGLSSAAAWYNPAAQLGINKAFLTFDLPVSKRLGLLAHVGAFGNSYGHMTEFDNGRYETPVVGATSGIGETVSAEYRAGEVTLHAEQGFSGLSDIAPDAIREHSYTGSSPAGSRGIAAGSSLCPTSPERSTAEAEEAEREAARIGPAYGWPDCNVGTSFVHHLHAGVGVSRWFRVVAHWLHAFSRDNRTPDLPPSQQDPAPSLPSRDQPDGDVDVLGLELRAQAARAGNAFIGASHTRLVDAATVGNVLSVLNAGGGAGLARAYLGPRSRGNGSITALGWHYDISLRRALEADFSGTGRDLSLSVFGLLARSSSPDPDFDGKRSVKAGIELTYSALFWLALQGRYDAIAPNHRDSEQTRQIATARVIAKSEWLSRERVWLQYSRWFNGDRVIDPNTSSPPTDRHMLALVASLWW